MHVNYNVTTNYPETLVGLPTSLSHGCLHMYTVDPCSSWIPDLQICLLAKGYCDPKPPPTALSWSFTRVKPGRCGHECDSSDSGGHLASLSPEASLVRGK